jgi:hypothetical protein
MTMNWVPSYEKPSLVSLGNAPIASTTRKYFIKGSEVRPGSSSGRTS